MTRMVSGTLCAVAAIAVILMAGQVTACKKSKPKAQPPVKITNVVAKVMTANHRRVLKVDYVVENINNRCKEGVCAAEIRTKIRVKRPDRQRVALDKDDLRRSFAHHEKEAVTTRTFSFKLKLPVATPAGSYRLRVEADDKVSGRLAVKKIRFEVPPEVLSTVKIKSLRVKPFISGDDQFIDVVLSAEGMHNRCGPKRCKVNTEALLRITTPQGKPFPVSEYRSGRTITNTDWSRTWLKLCKITWTIPLGDRKKMDVGKWTFKVELKDKLSKKSAAKQITVLIEKTKKR